MAPESDQTGLERWIGAPGSGRRAVFALLMVIVAFAMAIVLVYGFGVSF
jgi:hypothetical protein